MVFFRFLGGLKTPKRNFKINWPLAMIFLHIFLTSTYLAILFRKWTMVRAGRTGCRVGQIRSKTCSIKRHCITDYHLRFSYLPPALTDYATLAIWGPSSFTKLHNSRHSGKNSKCGRPHMSKRCGNKDIILTIFSGHFWLQLYHTITQLKYF